MNDINPIKPVIETPVLTTGFEHALLIIASVLFLAAVVWLFWRYWKKYMAKLYALYTGPVQNQADEIDYEKDARRKLAAAGKLIEQGEYKRFHLEASAIIKAYLSNVYGKNFTDMTTQELTASPCLPAGQLKELKEFFTMADLAKFAGRAQERGYAEQVLKIAETIITLRI